MISSNVVILVAISYVAVLFGVAALADRQVAKGQFSWLKSPMVYTLSLSVYCTGWTFYGAVGSAVRNGLEFAAIYIGPTLLFIGWFWLLRKLVRVGRTQRITSIADLVSSRFGKSNSLAIIVTLLTVVSSTPYIALQLQSLTISYVSLTSSEVSSTQSPAYISFWFAVGLAGFTILFGTRNVDVNERHHGVVTAIALEAIVKLAALLAVGLFVVFWLSDGPADIFSRAPESILQTERIFGPRWVTLNMLSAMAILTLPRMFHVLVVENVDERHLATAAWAFPLYIFLISLFVIPIGIAGLSALPEGSNPDMFVLTVPLASGQTGLALLAFLGGLSAATSMVIVSSIALSTMVSNHIIVPIWLRIRHSANKTSGDVRGVLLISRRLSIAAILALGFLYFRLTGGSEALASIGLIAFAGLAQIVPSLLAGLFWRGANRYGAATGMITGSVIWAYTLFLPSFGGDVLISSNTIANGLFGWEALRPQALFGLTEMDPLVHAVFWSIALNTCALIFVSLATVPNELERLQSALFVDVFRRGDVAATPALGRHATSEDLYTLAQRILGTDRAYAFFLKTATEQGKQKGLPDPTNTFIRDFERELSGSVGSASAHAMVSQVAGGGTVSVDDLMNIADETAQILQYSQQLEAQSKVLEDTAAKLRAANAQLTELGEQKDLFLSHVSHELRTPMTSIRSFAEILSETPDISHPDAQKFIGIIDAESQRLTRLLDEILDLSFLESGRANWTLTPVPLASVIERARQNVEALEGGNRLRFDIPESLDKVEVKADPDRAAQVLINLFTNVLKYGDASKPRITLSLATVGDAIQLDVHDNGAGISSGDHSKVFEKFTRLTSKDLAGSAGLGLPISREIMRNLGGELELLPHGAGTTFRATFQKV